MDRLEQLHQFLKEDPNDPFTLYALATEYLKIDELQALEYYKKLLAEHETYVGTYYHAAKLQVKLGQKEEAEKIFKKGIQICRDQKKLHALNELQRAYNEFLDDEGDE